MTEFHLLDLCPVCNRMPRAGHRPSLDSYNFSCKHYGEVIRGHGVTLEGAIANWNDNVRKAQRDAK